MSSTDYLRGPLGVLSEFEGAGDVLGWSVDYVYAAGRLIATTKPPAGAWHTIALTVTGDLACTATFTRTYTLSVGKSGDGAFESLVTSDPAGVWCGDTCAATYDAGTSVTLSADAAEGYEFQGWSGAGCGTGTVTMDQARSCTAEFAAPPPTGCDPEAEQRCQDQGGRWDSSACLCDILYLDPLAIALDGRPVRLTGLAGGVTFDLDGDGIRERVAWTVAGAAVGFLALDRDGDGGIDHPGELFGQTVSGRRRPDGTANSFADLAAFDRPEHGGDGDGLISAADAVFARLRLWVDANHDGVSQPGELLTLAQAGIDSIELSPQPIGRKDAFGNVFRYRAIVYLASGRQTTVWDVFLVARATGSAPASAAGMAWPAVGGTGAIAAGLAWLGVGVVGLAFVGLARRRPRRRRCPMGRVHTAVARVGVTGLTTVAAVLLWPAAGFGQAPQVVEYYDVDAIGSVRAVTNAQGQVVARHDFLPFGEELNPQTPPHDKRLFTGRERDVETGQDYVGARQLRTDLGRFLAPDPMSSAPRLVGSQGLNAYAYVRNNPLGLVDPSGLDPRTADSPQEIYPDWSPTDLPPGAVVDLVGSSDLKFITVTLTLGGTVVNVQYRFGVVNTFADDTKLFGVNMAADPQSCDACRWAQVVKTTGPGANDWEKDGDGIGPLYPSFPSPPNRFWDVAQNAGGAARTFHAITVVGVPDYQSQVFTVLGAMTWGYRADASGKVTMMPPAEAFRAQLELAIHVLGRSAPGWKIFY